MTGRNLALALAALLVPAFPICAQDVAPGAEEKLEQKQGQPQDELKDDVKDDREDDDGFRPAGDQQGQRTDGTGQDQEAQEQGRKDQEPYSKSPEAGDEARLGHEPRQFVFLIDDEDFTKWTAEVARSEQMALQNQQTKREDTTLEAGAPREDQAGSTEEKQAGKTGCVKLEGTIDEVREFDIEGYDDDHDMLKVRTKDGLVCIVDLGPDDDSFSLELENGDLVCVEGENGEINGQKVLFAHEVSEKARISWSGIELPAKPMEKGGVELDKDAIGKDRAVEPMDKDPSGKDAELQDGADLDAGTELEQDSGEDKDE